MHLNKTDTITATWALSLEDYSAFCEFYNEQIEAVQPFLIELITLRRIQYPVIAWFQAGTFQLIGASWDLYQCTSGLEIMQNG